MPKTWAQKLNIERQPEVAPLEKGFAGIPAGALLLVPTPLMVKAYVDSIPFGSTKTIAEMRDDLAKAAGADATCPLTSGIFARIVVEAALDELRAGTPEAKISPFWRLVEPKSPLAGKLSCGREFVAERRDRESKKLSE